MFINASYQAFVFVVHRRVIVILDMEVIKSADQMAGKIGDPTPYVEGKCTFYMSNLCKLILVMLILKHFKFSF